MIINDVNALLMVNPQPIDTKLFVMKNGVLQTGYTTSSFDFITASGYTTDTYMYITQNGFGRIDFNFSAPKKYLYVTIQAYQNTTSTSYSFRATNNNSRLGDTQSWYDINGISFKATPSVCSADKVQLRMQPQCSGIIGISSYFGYWHIYDIWFSDETSDFQDNV